MGICDQAVAVFYKAYRVEIVLVIEHIYPSRVYIQAE